MRGYVITILSVSLIVILVALSMSLRNGFLSMERALIEPLPLTYAAFLMDDLAYEFNSMVGPQIAINESNSSIVVGINDTLHSYNHSADIAAYGTFLNTAVANSTASSITANFTNISGGMMRVFIDDDYVYTNNHTSREMLFTGSGGTNATCYNISINVTKVRGSVTPMSFNATGAINVTITYTDLNGTGTETGMVSANQLSTLTVAYANGSSVRLTIGPNGGNAGSLDIIATGTDANVSFAAVLPPLGASKERGYAYDATVDYVQDRVAKHSRFGK
jgi:hypothetical protein